jgi:hypothetical protein
MIMNLRAVFQKIWLKGRSDVGDPIPSFLQTKIVQRSSNVLAGSADDFGNNRVREVLGMQSPHALDEQVLGGAAALVRRHL